MHPYCEYNKIFRRYVVRKKFRRSKYQRRVELRVTTNRYTVKLVSSLDDLPCWSPHHHLPMQQKNIDSISIKFQVLFSLKNIQKIKHLRRRQP
jgi:hypothetical protein